MREAAASALGMAKGQSRSDLDENLILRMALKQTRSLSQATSLSLPIRRFN